MLKVETFVMLISSHYTTLSPSIRGVIGVNTLTTLKRLETGFEEEVKTADGGNKCDPPPNKALALCPSIYFHGGPASNTVF